jgi:hypothetical protein
MPLSAVQIANIALSNLGRSTTIQSFEEKSAEAKQASLWYAQTLDMALEAHDWHFARARAALALHNQDPPPEWYFRYVYPVNCIAIRRLEQVSRVDDAYPFTTEVDSTGENTILANVQNAVGVFTFRQTNPARFTPHFVDFLAYMLAANMAIALTSKRSIKDDNIKSAAVAFRRASGLSASQRIDEPERDADTIRARR